MSAESGFVSRPDAIVASKNLLARLRHFHPDMDPRRHKTYPKKPVSVDSVDGQTIFIGGLFGNHKFQCIQTHVSPKRQPRIAEIIRAVCGYYKVSEIDLLSERRTKQVCEPRQIAMYLSRKLTGRSLPYIGSKLGGKDHTTVLNGVRRIESKANVNPDLARDVHAIERRVLRIAAA